MERSGLVDHIDRPSVEFTSVYESDGIGTHMDSNRNYLDDMIKHMRKVVEIKKLAKELNPQYQQPPSWFMPVIDYVPINYSNEFLKKLESMTFTPKTNPSRDRIIGLSCHICETCLSTVPLPLYGFKESGLIVPSLHNCDPLRAVNVQQPGSHFKLSKVTELYRSSAQTMKKAIHEWWLDGLNPNLKLVPLVSPARNSYEFSLQLLKNYQKFSNCAG